MFTCFAFNFGERWTCGIGVRLQQVMNKLIVLSGHSGSGKTFLIKKIIDNY